MNHTCYLRRGEPEGDIVAMGTVINFMTLYLMAQTLHKCLRTRATVLTSS